jgi:hypothetical protein
MNMNKLGGICLFLFLAVSFSVLAQDEDGYRGSIPVELLRPATGESPRYPLDIVIGELGQGTASAAAYSFANNIGSAFLSARMSHPALASINEVIREGYLSEIGEVSPDSFRLGGGREEPDGAISFLIRFIGRDFGLTGELFVRYVTREIEGADGEVTRTGYWVFEDMLLEKPKSRDVETQEASGYRFDFSPYERFY